MWQWLAEPYCTAAIHAANGDLVMFNIGVLLVGLGLGGFIVGLFK